MKALALLLLVAGCTDHTDLLPRDGGDDGTVACTLPGLPIMLGADCAGALAAHLHRHALCSCSPLVLTRGLFTDGGMRPLPGQPPRPPIAAVGTDGNIQVGGPVQVAGALEAAGSAGASFNRTSSVQGTLRSGGPIGANQFLSVDGDAFSAGDVLGRVDIGGVLHLDPSAGIGPSVSAHGLAREPVTVAAPYDCAGGSRLDVPGLVAAHAAVNDDARISLAAAALADGTGPTALDLPCGNFYLTTLKTPAGVDLELRVHGRAALFVGGDVTLGAGLRVSLDPAAELDLVVAGNLSAETGLVGASSAAASVRLWLGATSVRLGGGTNLSALVYAPSAVLLGEGDLIATGALFAGGLSVAGDVAIRFDARVLAGGKACGAPPEPPVQ